MSAAAAPSWCLCLRAIAAAVFQCPRAESNPTEEEG
jgi:hypothetical protein